VGPRAGLDDVERRKFLTLPQLELRPLARPARSQSLYRLSYPASSQSNCRKADIKMYLTGIRRELYSTGSGQGPVASCCEHGNEPSGSLNSGKFLELLNY
jgi:hypothetical protein